MQLCGRPSILSIAPETEVSLAGLFVHYFDGFFLDLQTIYADLQNFEEKDKTIKPFRLKGCGKYDNWL